MCRGAGARAEADTLVWSGQKLRLVFHLPTLHLATCGQNLLSPDHPRRSRTAGKNLENRPTPRETPPADSAVDGGVDDLCEGVHERGVRHHDRDRRDRPESPALVASYRKTHFLLKAGAR
ncbi:hypothetical protein GCM10018773_60070 [Streptomyces candidus]|nr:hypothetical protein GCM10018773_60070 [Streptomyces candidus]